jgi:hypothetical protein
MFNPNPSMNRVALSDGRSCVVVDNILRDPMQFVAHAVARRADFSPEDSHYYPGPELRLPPAAHQAFEAFFSQYIRGQLGARRTRSVLCRMSMVTRKPEDLEPFQRIPHVDGGPFQPGEGNFAMVLYLFKDERLGGTSFFRPRVDAATLSAMMARGQHMDRDAFSALIDSAPAYPTRTNAYFEKMASVPAAFNRAVFYDGTIYHSGDIRHPELLSADPEQGRLTVNAFFGVRLNAC